MAEKKTIVRLHNVVDLFNYHDRRGYRNGGQWRAIPLKGRILVTKHTEGYINIPLALGEVESDD